MLQEISISHCALVLLTAIILFATKLQAARLPATLMSASELRAYAAQPNEVLPIQPVLLYPAQQAPQFQYEARSFKNIDAEADDEDNDIIYVKLLKRRSYRPHKRISDSASRANVKSAAAAAAKAAAAQKELSMKDIFYVKALANGQFSHRRLKWYRLPEFYAISVFHKGDQDEAQNLV